MSEFGSKTANQQENIALVMENLSLVFHKTATDGSTTVVVVEPSHDNGYENPAKG